MMKLEALFLLLFIVANTFGSVVCFSIGSKQAICPFEQRQFLPRIAALWATTPLQREDESKQAALWNRREVITTAAVTVTGALVSLLPLPSKAEGDIDNIKGRYEVVTLPSGLKYIELREGTGPTPQYGQLVSIGYKGYVKIVTASDTEDRKNKEPVVFDKVSQYLIKHGNGRIVAGLDEGLHTVSALRD